MKAIFFIHSLLLLFLLNQCTFSQQNSEEAKTKAEQYLNSGDQKQKIDIIGALEDYHKALKLNPKCYMCYVNIAKMEYEQKKYDFAIQTFFEALRNIDPKIEQDYTNISYCVQKIGEYNYTRYGENELGERKSLEVQLSIWDSLIMKKPDPKYYLERGVLKNFKLADYKAALVDYMFYYERGDGYKESIILGEIAFCNFNIGNYFEAIQFYNKAIEIRPKGDEYIPNESRIDHVYFNRGACKLNLGDYRGAIGDFKYAISIHPKPDPNFIIIKNYLGIVPMYNGLVQARLRLNDYQNAVNDLNECISYISLNGMDQAENKDLAEIFYLVGFAQYNLRNKENACSAWSKSGELGKSEAYDAIKKYCK